MTKKINIYQNAIECRRFSDKYVKYFHQKQANNDGFFVAGANRSYETLLLSLCDVISEKYPYIATKLKEHVLKYDKMPVIHQSAIDVLVDYVISSEKPNDSDRKIFISHSSKDKEIMEKFTDDILQLGIGLSREDIFCTSIEEMGIRNGEDIRRHIKENVIGADFSFLMISSNYKASEICLNEMGAIWATGNRVLYYLLPNVDFKEIGWLCDNNKADKLCDAVALDNLEEELTDFYGLPRKGGTWSRQRQNFVKYLTNKANNEKTNTRHKSKRKI